MASTDLEEKIKRALAFDDDEEDEDEEEEDEVLEEASGDVDEAGMNADDDAGRDESLDQSRSLESRDEIRERSLGDENEDDDDDPCFPDRGGQDTSLSTGLLDEEDLADIRQDAGYDEQIYRASTEESAEVSDLVDVSRSTIDDQDYRSHDLGSEEDFFGAQRLPKAAPVPAGAPVRRTPLAISPMAASVLSPMGASVESTMNALRLSPERSHARAREARPQREQFETLTTRASPRSVASSRSSHSSPRRNSRLLGNSHQASRARNLSQGSGHERAEVGHPAPWSPTAESIQSPKSRRGGETAMGCLDGGLGSPAGGALRNAVRELREIKAERDALKEALRAANPQAVVDKTKAQMDREFRLVIKAMMDEKARALRAANAKTDFVRDQLRLEQNRSGMLLAELEAISSQRRADVPRPLASARSRTIAMNVRTGAGPQVRFRRPDMMAPRPPSVSERFVFASDGEDDDDVVGVGGGELHAAATARETRPKKASPSYSSSYTPRPLSTPKSDMKIAASGDAPSSSKSSHGRQSAPAPFVADAVSRLRRAAPAKAGSAQKSKPAPSRGETHQPRGDPREEMHTRTIVPAAGSPQPDKISDCDRPDEIIFQSLLQAQPGNGPNVQVGRARVFLKQSELLPPSMQAADLDVMLVKHSRRTSVLTPAQFKELIADLALGLIRCGVISVDDHDKTQETVGEPWEWGVREPRTKLSKASALSALGRVLFPPATSSGPDEGNDADDLNGTLAVDTTI